MTFSTGAGEPSGIIAAAVPLGFARDGDPTVATVATVPVGFAIDSPADGLGLALTVAARLGTALAVGVEPTCDDDGLLVGEGAATGDVAAIGAPRGARFGVGVGAA